MFSFDTRVRYSELNKDGVVRPEAIVNYLQDCTTFHSDSLGADVDFYKKENKVWVLNSWQIEIRKDMRAEDILTIGTWPYDFSGAYGYRNFVIRDARGENVVEANTLWVFTDVMTGRPVKLTEEYTKFYELSEKLDMEYMDRKIKLPKEMDGVRQDDVPVKKSFIDTNGHVNNSRYIECATEYIPDGYKVRRIRAEYKRQARYGDVFYPVVYDLRDNRESGNLAVVLNDDQGRAYAVVEFDIYM